MKTKYRPGALWPDDPTPPNEPKNDFDNIKIVSPADTCRLHSPLGDCALKQAGCHSLYEVLKFLYPPWPLLAELRNRQDLPADVRAWLSRLDVIGGVGHRWR